jgi:hypothetical protein
MNIGVAEVLGVVVTFGRAGRPVRRTTVRTNEQAAIRVTAA